MVKRASGASTDAIATRVLIDARSKKRVTVKLWAPVEEAEEEWSCAFHITGMRKPERAFGIDAFQALGMALEGIKVRLRERGGTYTWRGGEQGDAGFPQMILLLQRTRSENR